ncbi:MAG: ATP synthase F1 subunit gamma [bacterium]|nr:ATP synthase F1 subunit gamma [bacterium]
MPSLREFNDRLASMAGMRRVTGTMKLVAGSHLHRAQNELSRPEGFTRSLAALTGLIQQPKFKQSRYLTPPPEKGSKILLVVMSADRGLCGGFNSAVVRAVREFHAKQKEREPAKIDLFYVGQKAYNALKNEYPNAFRVQPSAGQPRVEDSDRVAKTVMRAFHWKMYDEVWLISNHFINSMTNECRTERLLPDARPPVPKVKGEPLPLPRIIEPNDEFLLENIVYMWIQLSLYYAMLHSVTGELAARVMAMENSTMNLNTMEKDLRTRRNRARQAAITNELSEIVSGAEALK